jgi:hypothetical protein
VERVEPAEAWGTTAVKEREGRKGIHRVVEKAARDERIFIPS